MIRTTVTPTTNNLNLSLCLPDAYIGKKLEILAFVEAYPEIKAEDSAQQLEFEATRNKQNSLDTEKEFHANVAEPRKMYYSPPFLHTSKWKFDREEANER